METQFQLGVSLTFLKRDLALVIQKTKLKNSENKEFTVKEYLLIPTKLPSLEDSVTFTELKNDFDKIFGKDSTDSKEAIDKIETQLKENSSESSFDLNNIHFYLKTAYLYKKAYYAKDDKECDSVGVPIADDAKKSKWEYALSISIDSKKFFSEFKTMSINSISFSIWNTDRAIIKKMMELGSTDEIFKQLENPVKTIE